MVLIVILAKHNKTLCVCVSLLKYLHPLAVIFKTYIHVESIIKPAFQMGNSSSKACDDRDCQ